MIELLWSIDHEREWLASALACTLLPEDKVRLIRNYLASLKRRHASFDGDHEMDAAERTEMETYCLEQLYKLEEQSQ